MRKAERKQIIKALQHFLDEDPDKWEDGIDVLFELLGLPKWTEKYKDMETINVLDLMRDREGFVKSS